MIAVSYAPTVVHFEVTSNFQMYAGGIFSDPTCTGSALNHAVVAVG